MSGEQTDSASMVVLSTPATTKAATDRFTGDVWADSIIGGAGPGCARLATVRFSPGARTAWHCHVHGQTLHVTDGRSLVQSSDGLPVVMRPEDTVYTPPGVWHWHGAAPDAFMAHLALADSGAEAGVADVEWGGHISDDEYTTATTGGEAERSTQ